MKINKTILTAYCLISILIMACHPNPKDVLQKSYMKCKSIKSGSYEMVMVNNKNEDILRNQKSFHCNFEIKPDDSIYHSHFNIQFYKDHSLYKQLLYNGQTQIQLDYRDSSATIQEVKNWKNEIMANKFMIPIFTPIIELDHSSIPNKTDLKDVKNTYELIGIEDLNSCLCYHIKQRHEPENNDSAPILTIVDEREFWVSKNDYLPIAYSEYLVGLQGTDTVSQYSKIQLISYSFNQNNLKTEFDLSAIPSYFNLQDYMPEFQYGPLVQIGLDAPYWKSKTISGEWIDLRNLQGSVVLLDFFFPGCYPCVLSFPFIQSLHDKYQDIGLKIIGIDPYEESDTSLQKFFKKKNLSYSVISYGDYIAKAYHVSNYPSLFIIDKKGKVIYNQSGFATSSQTTIEALIQKALKQ